MALYVDEEQIWRCPKHPSRRRKTGICPKCLRDRLVTLCPDCASALPCASCPPPVVDMSSSSLSSSSSFSLFSFSRGGSRHVSAVSANNHICQLPNQVESDNPMLRRSRSYAVPFLRSRSRYAGGLVNVASGCDAYVTVQSNNNNNTNKPVLKVNRSKNNFWSAFTVSKSKKCDVHGYAMDDESNKCDLRVVNDNSTMMRSKSVTVGHGNAYAPVNTKQKGWYFPSPIKGFRYLKPPKSVTVA